MIKKSHRDSRSVVIIVSTKEETRCRRAGAAAGDRCVHTQGISRKRTVRCVFRRDVGMRPEIAFVSHLALVLHRLEEAKRYDVNYVNEQCRARKVPLNNKVRRSLGG